MTNPQAKPLAGKVRRAYQVQRHNAKSRDIPWKFSFDQWLSFWVASGHWLERGLKGDGYVMSRFGDTGPYSPENCEIIKASENSQQPQVRAKQQATFAKRPVDWTPATDYQHLRDRDHHPKAKAVICPDGIEYPSAALAAEAHGRTRVAISQRCRTNWGGWRYRDDP